MVKKMALLIIFVVIIPVVISCFPAYSADEYYLAVACNDGSFVKSGLVFSSITDAVNSMNGQADVNTVVIKESDKTVAAMKKGIAVSAGYLDGGKSIVTFTEKVAGQSQYISDKSILFYFETEKEDRVKVGINGLINYLPLKQLRLIPDAFLSDNATGNFADKYPSEYYSLNTNGDLLHYVSTLNEGNSSVQFDSNENITLSGFVVDKGPEFMKSGKKYYSLDGINYYTDRYLTEKNKAGVYYPYYKNLSYRSKTGYSAKKINKYIAHMNDVSNSSKKSALLGKGKAFIKAQKKNGVNALMELSFANLESGYGKSDYALNRFNLFGINAVDSDPDKATYFSSVKNCVNQHTKHYLSKQYFNPGANIDTALPASAYINKGTDYAKQGGDWRYFGTVPGDKAHGVNVQYCSDPYHGEKISGLTYSADKFLGGKDYGKYSIAITKNTCDVYAEPDESSRVLYNISNKSNSAPAGIPVVVLGEADSYYIIQSEMPVVVIEDTGKKIALPFASYDFERSIGYVKKSDLVIVRGQPGKYYSVKFVSGGKVIDSREVVKGEKVKEPTLLRKKGYTFKGWYTSPKGKTPYKFNKKIDKDIVLYAKWKINKYKVIIKDGKKTILRKKVKYNGSIKPPIKEGYKCTGLYKNAALTKKFSGKITKKTVLYAEFRKK